MTNALLAQPSRRYVYLLTAALWVPRYAVLVADALLDHGLTWSVFRAGLEGALTSSIGALLCLLMGRIMRHAADRWAFINWSHLFLLCTAMAIAWTTITRGVIARLFDALLSQPRSDPEPTLTVTFIFFAWAGGWLSVAYSEQLRETAARADQSAARIVELEALIGGAVSSSGEAVVTELWVPTRSGTSRLPTADLVMVTSEREYVRLRTRDGTEHLVRASLASLCARLSPAMFVQVHRSIAINKTCIAAIDRRATRGLMIILLDGSRVPVGRKYESEVRGLLNGSTSP